MIEEIIKCKYFVKEYEDFTNVCELGVIGKDDSFMACEYNSDCYYKQLKRLEQENKELLKYETYYLDKYIELKDSLEEIRKILLSPDMPEVKEQTIITSTMLNEIVRANRENKLQKIKQTIYEVLGND